MEDIITNDIGHCKGARQGKGESRDWYQVIMGGTNKSLNYSETIKVEGKSVMG